MSGALSNKKTRKKVYEKFGGRCAYCGCRIPYDDFHIDHIIPRRRKVYFDGVAVCSDKIHNLNPACITCNVVKGDRDVEEFRSFIFNKLYKIKKESTAFNILLKYNLIRERKINVVFYFEKQ